MTKTFCIPPVFWSELCDKACGFFWAGTRQPSNSGAECNTTAFQFLLKHNQSDFQTPGSTASYYHWEKLAFVTFWRSPSDFVLLCFDLHPETARLIRRDLALNPRTIFEPESPFALHSFVMLHVVQRFDQALWAWRDTVRYWEKRRPDHRQGSSDRYKDMHEIARHLIHCSESLTTGLSVVDGMIKECELHVQGGCGTSATSRRELDFHASMLKCLLQRSKALEARMQNEINLVSGIHNLTKAGAQ